LTFNIVLSNEYTVYSTIQSTLQLLVNRIKILAILAKLTLNSDYCLRSNSASLDTCSPRKIHMLTLLNQHCWLLSLVNAYRMPNFMHIVQIVICMIYAGWVAQWKSITRNAQIW